MGYGHVAQNIDFHFILLVNFRQDSPNAQNGERCGAINDDDVPDAMLAH